MVLGVPIAVVAVLIVLLAGSVLLRSAVGLANRTAGPAAAEEPIGWDWGEDEEEELWGPPRREQGIPEPGTGLGMLIILLAAVAQLAIGFGLAYVLMEQPGGVPPAVRFGAHVVGVAAGFVAVTALLAGTLPTTPKRAALAALYFYLFAVLLAVVLRLIFYIVFD